ncbi:MAG TPA: hypothetical protein PLC42_07975, partial [Parachlamydiaceae bacterium]|nr:hypothetical protein [Parachlamydiaceae bacterium]
MDVSNFLYSTGFNGSYFNNHPFTFPTPTEKSKSELLFDKIFDYLKKEGILDSSGQLTKDFEKFLPPDLKEAQIHRFNAIFSTPRVLQIPDTDIKIKFTLQEFFKFLDRNNIEIIGGALFWVLGAEYMKRLKEELQLPDDLFNTDFFDSFEKPAADIDIRAFCEEPAHFIQLAFRFFEQKTTEAYHIALKKRAFTKFYVQKDPAIRDNFSIISFKTEDNACFDIVFVKELARNHLFEHDALKLKAYDFNKSSCTLKLCSNSTSVLRPLLLKMAKILDATDIENINVSGACMLISYLAKGWRYESEQLEKMLCLKLLSNKVYLKLERILSNHFPSNPFAPLIFCFYISSLLSKSSESHLRIIFRELLPLQKQAIEKLEPSFLKNMLACVQYLEYFANQRKSFALVTPYLQIFGHLIYLFKSNEKKCKIDAAFTKIEGSNCLQLKFDQPTSSDPLYFTMRVNFATSLSFFKEAVEELKQELKEKLLPIFQSLLQFIDIGSTPTEQVLDELENVKGVIFNYLDAKEPLFQEIGFYLLSSLGIQEKSAKYLPDLTKKLMELLANESNAQSRKNLFAAFLRYWQTVSKGELESNWTQIEAFDALISSENYALKNLKKDFVLCFASFRNQMMTSFVINLSSEIKNLLNGDELLKLIKNIIAHSPEEGLKLLHLFLKDLPLNHAKALFPFILKAYQEAKNSFFFTRDAMELSSLLTLFFTPVDKLKTYLKKEEGICYLKLAHEVLNQNFLEGIKFLDFLEEKKIYAKGFLEILKEAADSEKTVLLLKQHQNTPIDYARASSLLLQERLSLLLSCGSNLEIQKELTLFLIGVIRNTKTITKNFKNKLIPKLEWLLLFLLETPEYLMEYFKICKEFNPQIALKDHLLTPLTKCIKNLSLEDQRNPQTILTINEFLADIEAATQKRTIKQYSPQLAAFYEALSALSLQGANPEIAGIYLQNTISYMQFKSLTPDAAFLSLFDDCVVLLLEKENFLLAFSLLKKIESTFQGIDILHKEMRWKSILLNFKEDPVSLAALIVEKITFFRDDLEIKEKAETIAKAIFSSEKISEAHFNLAFEVVKAYSLNSKKIFRSIAVAFSKLNNKKREEEILLFLLGQKLSLTRLIPLFEFFAKKSPTVCHILVEKIPSLIQELKETDEAEDTKIQELLFVFIKVVFSILDDTHPSHDAYVSTLELILGQLYLSPSQKTEVALADDTHPSHDADVSTLELISEQLYLSPSQKIEVTLAYVKAYKNSLRVDSNTLCWKYLLFLIKNPDIDSYIDQLLPLFASVFEISHFRLLQNNRKYFMASILPHLYLTMNALNFKFLAQQITQNSSYELMNIVIDVAKTIIILCPEKEITKIDEPYLSLKAELKKLFSIMLQQKKCAELEGLYYLFRIESFFTQKEILTFAKQLSTAYLNDPEVIKDAKLIESALAAFLISTTKPLEFDNSLIKQIIKHVLTLGIIFDNKNKCNGFLKNLSNRLFSWIADDPKYVDYVECIEQNNVYAYDFFKKLDPVKLDSNELRTRAKENCAAFLFSLIEESCALFLKVPFSQNSEDSLLRNLHHFNLLIAFFPEKRSEILQALLNFRYTALFFPHSEQELVTSICNHATVIMGASGFFLKVDKKLEELFLKFGIYAGFGADSSKFSLTENAKCQILYKVIKELLGFNTLRSLLTAYIHFNDHLTYINKINKEKEILNDFNNAFKKLYPNEKKPFHKVALKLLPQFKEKYQV